MKTNAHFIAFPLQQWLRERDSMLRYMHIAYLARSAIKIAPLFFVTYVRCLSELLHILCCFYQLLS